MIQGLCSSCCFLPYVTSDLFVQVVVSVVSEKCRIDTELLPSLFLRCTTDPLRREKYPAVTHLKFLTRENSEQVNAHSASPAQLL